jgi:hypothetical protein
VPEPAAVDRGPAALPPVRHGARPQEQHPLDGIRGKRVRPGRGLVHHRHPREDGEAEADFERETGPRRGRAVRHRHLQPVHQRRLDRIRAGETGQLRQEQRGGEGESSEGAAETRRLILKRVAEAAQRFDFERERRSQHEGDEPGEEESEASRAQAAVARTGRDDEQRG